MLNEVGVIFFQHYLSIIGSFVNYIEYRNNFFFVNPKNVCFNGFFISARRRGNHIIPSFFLCILANTITNQYMPFVGRFGTQWCHNNGTSNSGRGVAVTTHSLSPPFPFFCAFFWDVLFVLYHHYDCDMVTLSVFWPIEKLKGYNWTPSSFQSHVLMPSFSTRSLLSVRFDLIIV